MLRLIIFELLQGQRTALAILCRRHGVALGLAIAAEVTWRQWFSNPFQSLTSSSLTMQERCSRRQLAPALILYDVLTERGLTQEEAVHEVRLLVNEVATAFLKFSVPMVPKQAFMPEDENERLRLFKNTCARFFNAHGDVSLNGSHLSFQVDRCWFAEYCRQLGYQHLATVFCGADAQYFKRQQPNMIFARTTTLADGDDRCDFVFELKG